MTTPKTANYLSVEMSFSKKLMIGTVSEKAKRLIWKHIKPSSEIGYLVEEGGLFSVETDRVDPEISRIVGPQLVVPLMNARYALNAANALGKPLMLYALDAISEQAERR